MKKMVLTLMMVLILLGNSASAEWKEIPLRYDTDNDLWAIGHAYASEMPGGEVYVVGRAIFENESILDRWIESAYITVFTEKSDGTEVNMTVLGEETKIAPKIVERKGGMASMSFSGIVRGIPYENLACRLNETSIASPVICSPRGVVEAEVYEDERKNLILEIKMEEPIECDYDIGWGIIDKNGTLQWYEADSMLLGSDTANLKIPSELREGYVDSVESIDYAFAELYVRFKLAE